MKQILLTILAITLCLTIFSGCANNQYKGPLSCVSRIGADGVIIIENSKIADCKMRIFNKDG